MIYIIEYASASGFVRGETAMWTYYGEANHPYAAALLEQECRQAHPGIRTRMRAVRIRADIDG